MNLRISGHKFFYHAFLARKITRIFEEKKKTLQGDLNWIMISEQMDKL